MVEGAGKREPLMRQGQSGLFAPALWLWAVTVILLVSLTGFLNLTGAMVGSSAVKIGFFSVIVYAVYLRQIFHARRCTAALMVCCIAVAPGLLALLVVLPITRNWNHLLAVPVIQLYALIPCVILVVALVRNINKLERS